MNSEIRTTTRFRKEAKRLSKKYPSLKNDLAVLMGLLSNNPRSGAPIGKNFYNLRLQITSKGEGKSGGARVISHVDVALVKEKIDKQLFILLLFTTSQKEVRFQIMN